MINDMWILDLIDEYETKAGIPEARIARLANTFVDSDPYVMAVAVKTYILAGGRFFPRVGELLKHTGEAQRLADAGQLFKGGDHDDILYRVEVMRGTLDPAVTAAADDSARALLASWGRCNICGGQLASDRLCNRCLSIAQIKPTAAAN